MPVTRTQEHENEAIVKQAIIDAMIEQYRNAAASGNAGRQIRAYKGLAAFVGIRGAGEIVSKVSNER